MSEPGRGRRPTPVFRVGVPRWRLGGTRPGCSCVTIGATVVFRLLARAVSPAPHAPAPQASSAHEQGYWAVGTSGTSPSAPLPLESNLSHPAESPGPALASSSGVCSLVWSTGRPGSHHWPARTRPIGASGPGSAAVGALSASPALWSQRQRTRSSRQLADWRRGHPLRPGPWEGDTPGGQGTKFHCRALHGRVSCSRGCCSSKALSSVLLKSSAGCAVHTGPLLSGRVNSRWGLAGCPSSPRLFAAHLRVGTGRLRPQRISAENPSVLLVGAFVAGIDGSLGIFSGT